MRGTVVFLTFTSMWKDVGRISILGPPFSMLMRGGPSHTLACQSPPPQNTHTHTAHLRFSQTPEKEIGSHCDSLNTLEKDQCSEMENVRICSSVDRCHLPASDHHRWHSRRHSDQDRSL